MGGAENGRGRATPAIGEIVCSFRRSGIRARRICAPATSLDEVGDRFDSIAGDHGGSAASRMMSMLCAISRWSCVDREHPRNPVRLPPSAGRAPPGHPRAIGPGRVGSDEDAIETEATMAAHDTPRSASPEEEAGIGEMPAIFANKVYISPLPGGARITFAEAHRASGQERASPRVAVFLQSADLAALRSLLDWVANASETPPGRTGGSVH